ncbi:MAG: DUF2085 domain-containing protein [Ignavibacteria bacterium]|nr:DUF2085 domain-containing protein [Ignavibacteria bacterium]
MAPVLMANSKPGSILNSISQGLYTFFSTTCHQEESRSFHIFGEMFAVCSRCFILYAGFLAGVIVYPFFKKLDNTTLPHVWMLLSAAGLMLADVLLDISGIHKNTFLTRSITGFLLGVVLPFYLIPGFTMVYLELKNFKNYKKKIK